MTRLQFNITLIAGGLCLLLSILIIIFGQMNRSLERASIEQQITINRGNTFQQVGRNLLGDLGQVSLHNQKIHDLLVRNGFTVNQTPANSSNDGGNR